MNDHYDNLIDLTEYDSNAYGSNDIFITRTKYFLFICGPKFGYKLFYINSNLKKTLRDDFADTRDIAPYMTFSKKLSSPTITLFSQYGGFNGCYYNVDLKTDDLDEVVDPGILKSVRLYLDNIDIDSAQSALIKKYSEGYKGSNEYNIYIGKTAQQQQYDLIVQSHSWDIIKYLLGYPESIFYCDKAVKQLYPLIPSDRIRLVKTTK